MTGQLRLPEKIVIKNGEAETTFSLGVIDNNILDGSRDVVVTASIFLESCGCSVPPGIGGVADTKVTILDDDGPALSATTHPNVVVEGITNAGVLRISRNTGTETALSISIAHDHPTEIEIAPTASFAPGASSLDVPFSTIDDGVEDGDQVVPIRVSADGFEGASTWVMVTDRNLPDLVVTSFELSSDVMYLTQQLPLTIEVANQGNTGIAAGADVKVYLSESPSLDGSALLVSSLSTSQPIAAGGNLVMSDTLRNNLSTGQYYLIATVNKERTINELIYHNNDSEPQPLLISPDYHATASVDGSVFNGKTPILITGVAETFDGQPAAFKDVDVYVVVTGARRIFRATTDENGHFSHSFIPVSGEAGDYYVGACFPGEDLDEVQDTFTVLGMKYDGDMLRWEVYLDDPLQGEITVKNHSSIDLTGVLVEVVSAPPNCQLTFGGGGTLAGDGYLQIAYTLQATEPTPGRHFQNIRLRITSNEGADHHFSAMVYARSVSGLLFAEPMSLNTTMLMGNSTIREFKVTNNGMGETGPVWLSLPEAGWMKVAGQDTIPNILPGASAVVTLRLTPTADLPLNVPITGSIGIHSEKANTLQLPFRIETVSEATGRLLVDVVNEYTYLTDAAPHVEGAKVVLRHPFTGVIVAEGITGADGIIQFDDIPEGYYVLNVSAMQHLPHQETIFLEPGLQTEALVFISFQAISYSWEVTPTLIEDEYSIELIAEFETNVPVPVVVMDIPDKLPDLGIGEFFPFVITLTNYGLITANNLRLSMPDYGDFTFTHMFESMDLPARQSIQIPVIMERKYFDKSGGGCAYVISAAYEYVCGNFTVGGSSHQSYQIEGGGCGGAIPVGWLGGGGGILPFGAGSSIYDCDTCKGEVAKWLLECVACNIPAVSVYCTPYNIFSCFTGLYSGCGDGIVSWKCAESAARCSPNQVIGALFCLKDFMGLCEGPGNAGGSSEKSNSPGATKSLSPTIVKHAQEMFQIAIDIHEAAIAWQLELYGDSIWFEADANELQQFLDYLDIFAPDARIEITEELLQQAPSNIADEAVVLYVERRNNTLDKEDGLSYDENNVADLDKIALLIALMQEKEAEVHANGYASVYDMLGEVFEELEEWASQPEYVSGRAKSAGASVCARVTLKFSQSLTMTREAFEASLTIFNGNDEEAMQNIRLELDITDESGTNSNHLFQINTHALDNISGIDGQGTLGADQTGQAVLQIIPTRNAAPEIPVTYYFGGTFSYLDPFTNEMITHKLFPVPLQVNPSPELHIDYFMQRDILADDPLTDPIEPSIPAELAVMIHNRGAGTALNVNIESAQPEIIENEKGLLIDFEIIGSNLNGQDVQLGLLNIDFGDLEGGEIAVGQWWFTSTLLGRFISFEVSVNHLNSFGNPDISLIGDVKVHELVKSVSVYGEFDDGVGDFLVNNIPDMQDIPDALYYSNGIVEPVYQAFEANIEGPVRLDRLEVDMVVTPHLSGWNYIRLDDPGDGLFRIVSCIREDGQEIPLENIWLSHVRIPLSSKPVYRNKLHFIDIFDGLSPVSYTVVFEPVDQDVPEVIAINGIPEGITEIPLEGFEVVFNKAIDPETFDHTDMHLRSQGGSNLMDDQVQVTQLSPTTFYVDISDKTAADGLYTLIVQAADVADLIGNFGRVGKEVFWIQATSVPAIERVIGLHETYGPPLDSLLVSFNMPVIPSTFSNSQLILRQIGGDTLDMSGIQVTLANEAGNLFQLTGLESLNQAEAIYELTFLVTGVTAENGENGVFNQSVRWTVSYGSDHLFALVLLAEPEEGGEVTGSGSYYRDQEIALEAIPNAGYYFIGWTGETDFLDDTGMTEDRATASLTMPAKNLMVTAQFALATNTAELGDDMVNMGTGDLKAYPNPARNTLHVEFVLSGEHPATISLYNLHGQRVISHIRQESGLHQLSLNTATLAPGMYLLRLDDNGVSLQERIIIR
jgi:large repetitive protein